MNNSKRTIIALAALLGLVATTAGPTISRACYVSPEDMVRMTAQSHFWQLAEEDPAVDEQQLRVHSVVIEGETAVALVELVTPDHTSYHQLSFAGERYRWELVKSELATSEASLAMAMMSRLDAISLRLYQARASRALAKR